MAKFRRSRSRGFRALARRTARRAGVGKTTNLVQIDAMAYGAVRAPISDFVQKSLPLPVIGTIGDEVAMGAVCWLVAKNTSGMMRDVALKGLVVENARLGEALLGGALGSMTGGGSTSSPNVLR